MKYFSFLLMFVSFGALSQNNTVESGYKVVAGTEETIDAYGVCKKVSSSGSNFFVPTRSSEEYNSFVNGSSSFATVVDCGTSITCYTDNDSDGYGAGGGASYFDFCPAGTAANSDDCDDTDPALTTTCTSITCYTDNDADGYGVGTGGQVFAASCPSGQTATFGDCDDTDPALTTTCSTVTCYSDNDADGYGAGAGTSRSSCLSGEVTSNNDCDDTDATLTTSCVTCYPDNDNDDYRGSTTSTVMSSCGTGYTSSTNDDCDDTNASLNTACVDWEFTSGTNVANCTSGMTGTLEVYNGPITFLNSSFYYSGSGSGTVISMSSGTNLSDGQTVILSNGGHSFSSGPVDCFSGSGASNLNEQ